MGSARPSGPPGPGQQGPRQLCHSVPPGPTTTQEGAPPHRTAALPSDGLLLPYLSLSPHGTGSCLRKQRQHPEMHRCYFSRIPHSSQVFNKIPRRSNEENDWGPTIIAIIIIPGLHSPPLPRCLPFLPADMAPGGRDTASHALSLRPDTRGHFTNWLLKESEKDLCAATAILHFSENPTKMYPFQCDNTEALYRQ